MPLTDGPKRAGVLGWPVAHSRSPAMHEAAYRALGLDGWRYQLLPVPPELFAQTAAALGPAGFVGANVTIPHKEAALAIALAHGEATPAARQIGAANSLTFRDDVIHADNTDAPGMLAALPWSPIGRRALVLGAGGSARAAVWALLSAGADDVMVWNRTAARAEALCEQLGGRPVTRAKPADLLVNCTAVGLLRSDPWETLPLGPEQVAEYECVADLVYGGGPSVLLEAACRAGRLTVDGLEVLVRQGALSFEAWTGVPPPLVAMRAAAGAGRLK